MTGNSSSPLVEARVKHLLREVVELSTDGSEKLLSVSEYYGVAPRSEVADAGDHLSRAESLEGYKKCIPGDLVMNIMLAWKRALGVTAYEGIVSPAYAVFRPDRNKLSPRFAHYFFRSDSLISEFKRLSTGVVDSRLRLYPEVFGGMTVQIPPVDQQESIANFLDEQTSRIDALIAEKGKLITTLLEYRKAIISEATTRGLDSNVTTRPSGQPWLGEIPAHWQLTKLKHMGEALIGLTYSPSDVTESEDGVLVLRSSNVQQGQILLDDTVYVTCPIPEKLRVQPGDILICSRNGSRALIGKNATVGIEHAGMSFGAFMTVFRGADNFYVRWLLNSSLFEYHSASFLTSTINQLTTSNLNSLVVPLPPYEERRTIDEYLTRRTSEIDLLSRHVEAHISSLQEYRSSLISAAVTGKVDLSNFKAAA